MKSHIKTNVTFLAEDKDNKLMSSEGLEATEAEMEEVLGQMDDRMDTGITA